MKTSTNRILTTYVGSVARPVPLLQMMREKERTNDLMMPQPINGRLKVRSAIGVKDQVDVGVDIVTNGELGKIGFLTYVKDRLEGFSATDDEQVLPDPWKVEIADFPEYDADHLR